ncbi:MAG: DNA primase small subunit PriS [Candidatus Bathyarchaeia archaeon]
MSFSREFVKRKFETYYRESYTANHAPKNIERREFGFLTFDEKTMLRHISFRTRENLESFLRREAYSDVYYSCAYYENAEAEMDKKGWLGADLIFDIDADHIPTPCNKVHDEWVCGSCGFSGKGIIPENCPVCGSRKFDANTWPCETCLNSAKTETVKLLDMLTQDFGFSEKEIHVFFSGHRGFHVHVENEAYMSLDAIARKEIVDYITGLGLDMSFHGLQEKSLKRNVFSLSFSSADVGWRRRMASGIADFISKASEKDLMEVGLKRNVIETILKNRESLIAGLKGSAAASAVKGVGFETWRKIAEHVLGLLSTKIDTVVTTDTHRLIRLADTLHGKTGLKKVEFPPSEIESFDPFKRAIAFKEGTATIFVSDAPEFRVGDEAFGPYKNQRVELPTAAAILLVCKGRAEVVN